MVVAAPQFKFSYGMCSKFKPQPARLLRSRQRDPWLGEAIQNGVATAQQFGAIIWVMCSKFRAQVISSFAAILVDGSVITWAIQTKVVTVLQFHSEWFGWRKNFWWLRKRRFIFIQCDKSISLFLWGESSSSQIPRSYGAFFIASITPPIFRLAWHL